MASYIVEIENTSNSAGVRPFAWVIVEANSDGEANAKANQGLGANERAGMVMPNSDEGFRRLRLSSPDFARKYGFRDYQSFVENTPGANFGDIGGDIGGGGGGAGGQTPPGPILGSEDFGLLPAFEAGLSDRGMGFGVGSGVAGQLAGQEFGNLQSRGLLDAAFFAPPGQIDTSQFADADRPTAAELNKFQGTTFQDYVKNAALFGGGATADANRLFSEAVRLSEGRTPGFTRVADPEGNDPDSFLNRFDAPGIRGLPTPIAGAFLNPQQGAAGSEDLARAARQAGRSRFGFASKFLPSAGNLTNSFFAQPQQGAQTFADFLSNKIFGV